MKSQKSQEKGRTPSRVSAPSPERKKETKTKTKKKKKNPQKNQKVTENVLNQKKDTIDTRVALQKTTRVAKVKNHRLPKTSHPNRSLLQHQKVNQQAKAPLQ